MKISCGTICYMNIPVERALSGIRNAGFDYVELLSIPTLPEHVKPETSKEDLNRLRREVASLGLAVLAVSAHVQPLAKSPSDTPKAMEALRKRIDLAHYFEATYVNTGVWTLDVPTFYDTIGEMADFCESRGVKLGLEVGEPGLTVTGRQAMELLKPVSARTVGINYDTANIVWSAGVKPEDDLPLTISRVIHMHVKDQTGGKGSERFPPLGKGEIDLPAVFSVIRKSSFRGPFCLEMEVPANGPESRDREVSESRAVLLELLSGL